MKSSAFVGISLDGFLARPNGAFDFLSDGGEPDGAANGFNEFLATVDAVLMGRNTYEVVLPFPIWPYGKRPVFVLSSRVVSSSPPDAMVEQIAGTPAEVAARLQARAFQHVYIDGGLTIQSFLRAGLLHRMVVTRVPVLIGTGIPLFGPLAADVRLDHVLTRVLPGGAVQSEYAVSEDHGARV